MNPRAVLVTAALALAGCATPGPSRVEPLDAARPLAVGDPRVVSLASALEATASDRRTLVGSAHVRLAAPDLRFSRPQRLALSRPSSLRVEILGPFDQVVAILTTDGLRYQFYDPSRPRIDDGVARSTLLWEVARVDLEAEEAVGLLLGAPVESDSVLEAARTRADRSILLAFRCGDGSRRIFEFDPSAQLVRVRHRAADDLLLWEAAYEDYRALGERSFAHRVAISFPGQETDAVFSFEAAELNRDLPPGAFVITLPSVSR